jgi:hypothetical protein
VISAFKTKINHSLKARKEPFKELRMEIKKKANPRIGTGYTVFARRDPPAGSSVTR